MRYDHSGVSIPPDFTVPRLGSLADSFVDPDPLRKTSAMMERVNVNADQANRSFPLKLPRRFPQMCGRAKHLGLASGQGAWVSG
jgi:hypothetical protein